MARPKKDRFKARKCCKCKHLFGPRSPFYFMCDACKLDLRSSHQDLYCELPSRSDYQWKEAKKVTT